MSAERKTVSDLLMVRILNQLLSVFQISNEIVLRGNRKQISTTSKELYPINPLLITSEVTGKQEKGEEEM